MRLPFRELPDDAGGTPRPVLGVCLGDDEHVRFDCLLDTGAVHNRFGSWVAQVLGIESEEGQRQRLAVGGVVVDAVTVPLRLSVGEFTWQAPVSFCDPWPFGFNLLGQEGFFRFFRVTLAAARYTVEIEPDRGPVA
jgi:hypothetical protein